MALLLSLLLSAKHIPKLSGYVHIVQLYAKKYVYRRGFQHSWYEARKKFPLLDILYVLCVMCNCFGADCRVILCILRVKLGRNMHIESEILFSSPHSTRSTALHTETHPNESRHLITSFFMLEILLNVSCCFNIIVIIIRFICRAAKKKKKKKEAENCLPFACLPLTGKSLSMETRKRTIY